MPAKLPTAADPRYVRATEQGLREDVALLAAHEPPPAPAAPALSAAEKARRLRDLGAAAYLYGSGSAVLGEAMDVEAWKIVLDDFLKEMGLSGASGPVARMMAEQLLLAHHAVGRLHVRAATRTSPAEVAAYHASVSRLMTEFRRTSAALKAYGAGAARRAVAPRTRPRPPSGERPARRAKKAQRGKVASNGNGVRGHIRGRKHAIA
jgi:hypothetical protein